MQIPKLFCRGVFVYGKPIEIARNLGKDDLQKYSEILEEELNKLSKEADNYYNKKKSDQE